MAVAVTAGMFVPLAVMIEDPGATPVTGTVTVVVVAKMVTVAGTVATPGVPELRLMTTPPTGAGEESVKVRLCVAVPIMLTVGALKEIVALTLTLPVPATKPVPVALIAVEPSSTPVMVGWVTGAVAPWAIETLAADSVAMPGVPTTRLTVTAENAGVDKVTGKATVAPGARFVTAGRMICPGASAVTVTVTGALLTKLSLTMSWITYEPATSGVNVGETLVGAKRMAVLPTGRLLNVQE